jgi:Family of unknown function (DUF6267)
MNKTYRDYLAEAIGDGPRIPHPEDSILQGSVSAEKFLGAFTEIINKPQNFTIKWDGGIALYFGRNQQGQFFMTDKYMPSKGVYPTSPAGWREYDTARGADRADLYAKIEAIWPGLERSVTANTGVFKGDLMAIGQKDMTPVGSSYNFGTVTVQYSVPVNSYLGELMKDKVALIVVHEYADRPWDGRTGLANVGDVAVVSPNLNLKFGLSNKPAIIASVNEAKKVLANKGSIVDQFLAGLDNAAKVLIGKYLNQLRTQQTKDEIAVWLEKNANKKQFTNLVGDGKSGYLARNKAGLDALYNAWNSMFNAKVAIVQSLESQVQGFSQTTSAGPGGEGFVFPSSVGLIKLINPNFGAAHFGSAGFAKSQ